MNENATTGGWRRGQDRVGERSGPPESRPQLAELRSGEWVTEPPARDVRGDRTRRIVRGALMNNPG